MERGAGIAWRADGGVEDGSEVGAWRADLSGIRFHAGEIGLGRHAGEFVVRQRDETIVKMAEEFERHLYDTGG